MHFLKGNQTEKAQLLTIATAPKEFMRWLLRNQAVIWNVGIGLCIALGLARYLMNK